MRRPHLIATLVATVVLCFWSYAIAQTPATPEPVSDGCATPGATPDATPAGVIVGTPVVGVAGAQPPSITLVDACGTPIASPETGATTDELTVEMEDIAFAPSELAIPANTDVTISLPNTGTMAHDFVIDELDIRTESVQPGETATVTINAPAGTYDFYCSVPGHAPAGMVGTLSVE